MSEPGHWQDPAAGAPNQQPQYAQQPLPQVQAPGAALNYRPDYWAHPAPAPAPKRVAGTGVKVINIILLCVFGLVAVGTLVFFAFSLGVSVFLICGTLALIPLAICVLALMWIDKWEPEPVPALILGFCWGAGMAVITTLVLGSWVQPLLMAGGTDVDADMDADIDATAAEESAAVEEAPAEPPPGHTEVAQLAEPEVVNDAELLFQDGPEEVEPADVQAVATVQPTATLVARPNVPIAHDAADPLGERSCVADADEYAGHSIVDHLTTPTNVGGDDRTAHR